MTEEQKEAFELLDKAGLFFGSDPEFPREAQTLNMNDVWAWALACGEYVHDEELPEVARLFRQYGYCGVLYWVSKKNEGLRSEFADNNRFIDFVAHEEAIRKAEPDDNKRAYLKESYTIGAQNQQPGD